MLELFRYAEFATFSNYMLSRNYFMMVQFSFKDIRNRLISERCNEYISSSPVVILN